MCTMTPKEWVELIVKEFEVSKRVAKDMYHSMISIYQLDKREQKGN